MSMDNIDFKHYLKKLDLEDIEKVLSNEDLQNCLQTISNIEDDDILSKSGNKSKAEFQSISSSDIVDVKKLNLSNLKIKSLLKDTKKKEVKRDNHEHSERDLLINKNLNLNLKNLLPNSFKYKSDNVVREDFVDWNCIFIDENEYIHLKSKKSEDLRLHQLSAIKVYEKIQSIKNELSEMRKTMYEIRDVKQNLETEIGILKKEFESLKIIKDSEISTLREKNRKKEEENVIINNKIDKFTKFQEENQPKIYKYDDLFRQYKDLKNETDKLLESTSSQAKVIMTIKNEKDEINNKLESYRLENESLKNDKMYLNKECMTIGERYRMADDKVKMLEDEIREIRKSNQNYIEKLTDKNCNLENVFEDKLKRELEDMKRKYTFDLDNLKKLYTEIGDKRSEYLIQEKDESYLKLKKLEQTIKDKEETYDFLNNEYRNLQKRSDEEISMLKIHLTVKLEDYERLSNLYQEHLQMIKALTLEKEAYKDKLDLMRNELIKKESQFKDENSELKAQLSIFKEKISNYEQIENELDKVIVSNLDDHDVLPIIKDIPTASKRRISQCLILANKLKLCSVEIEKLKLIISKNDEENQKINDENNLMKNIIEKSKQPYQYLVKNIENLERELNKRNRIVEDLDKTNKSLLRENELQNDKIRSLENDLKNVLNNRSKLDNLEGMIYSYINVENDQKQRETAFKQSINKSNYEQQHFYQAEKDLGQSGGGFSNLKTAQSIFPMSIKNEKDFLKLTDQNKSIENIPEWYVKLKNKKNI